MEGVDLLDLLDIASLSRVDPNMAKEPIPMAINICRRVGVSNLGFI